LFAVGHLALGYIWGFVTSKALKTNINIPLVLLLSVIPDIDILMPQIQHRGPTHSIIAATLLFVPLFIIYKKKVIPYFAALTQHFLVGDLIVGNIQLFWPLNTQNYGMGIGIESPINVTAEWIFFVASVSIMLKTNQMAILCRQGHSHLLLSIPVSTLSLPIFLGFPSNVPIWLIPPHLFYMFIFSIFIIIDLFKILKNHKKMLSQSSAHYEGINSASTQEH